MSTSPPQCYPASPSDITTGKPNTVRQFLINNGSKQITVVYDSDGYGDVCSSGSEYEDDAENVNVNSTPKKVFTKRKADQGIYTPDAKKQRLSTLLHKTPQSSCPADEDAVHGQEIDTDSDYYESECSDQPTVNLHDHHESECSNQPTPVHHQASPPTTTQPVLGYNPVPQRTQEQNQSKTPVICHLRCPGYPVAFFTYIPAIEGALVLPLSSSSTTTPSKAIRGTTCADATPINDYYTLPETHPEKQPQSRHNVVLVKRCTKTLPRVVRGKPTPDVDHNGNCTRFAETNFSGLCKRCAGRK